MYAIIIYCERKNHNSFSQIARALHKNYPASESRMKPIRRRAIAGGAVELAPILLQLQALSVFLPQLLIHLFLRLRKDDFKHKEEDNHGYAAGDNRYQQIINCW